MSDYVDLNVKLIIRETDKAFLCAFDDGEEEWIPKSQISDWEDYEVGDADLEISVTEWLAREKGLI